MRHIGDHAGVIRADFNDRSPNRREPGFEECFARLESLLARAAQLDVIVTRKSVGTTGFGFAKRVVCGLRGIFASGIRESLMLIRCRGENKTDVYVPNGYLENTCRYLYRTSDYVG